MTEMYSPTETEARVIDFNLGEDAILYLIKHFYPPDEADYLFQSLLHNISWAEETIFIAGKPVKVPRLMGWYGDPAAIYRYSGVNHHPIPWIPEFLTIKKKAELACRSSFNSVLANLYRDGNDSMGYHSDDEKELGVNPTIASLSLGDERVFKLSHKKNKRSLSIDLSHGDLLVMGGTCQHLWRHAVPKTKARKNPRINLTFRLIESG